MDVVSIIFSPHGQICIMYPPIFTNLFYRLYGKDRMWHERMVHSYVLEQDKELHVVSQCLVTIDAGSLLVASCKST